MKGIYVDLVFKKQKDIVFSFKSTLRFKIAEIIKIVQRTIEANKIY